MRYAIIAALLVSGCDNGQAPTASPASEPGAPVSSARWSLQSSGEGAALALLGPNDRAVVRLFCEAAGRQMLVNVQGFTPIASEERMTIGSGGRTATLVAGGRGDPERGGVSGSGPVPANIEQLLSGGISINYGAQTSGPHPAADAEQLRMFAAACADGASVEEAKAPVLPVGGAPAGACRTQDGKTLPANRLKAVGTEPFWAATIDGRCVTYSHPENQSGTRVWTKFSGSRETGTWTGSYEGKPFVLRTRPQAGCSDGMSDRRYPVAVTVTVNGEDRQGCADAP